MTAGNCYERAFHAIWLGLHDDIKEGHELFGEPIMYLVHGFPTGTGGGVEGKKYGHAWLELCVKSGEHESALFAIDCGCHDGDERNIVPTSFYYNAGSIIPEECRRYTREEAMKKANEFKHYGDWLPRNEVPEGVVYADEN